MASKAYASTALLLSLNLLFFAMVSSTNRPVTNDDKCSVKTTKLSVCADILHLISTGSSSCCSLIAGLVDLEASVCLCKAIKAKILGTVIDIPVALKLILGTCGKSAPSRFQCS